MHFGAEIEIISVQNRERINVDAKCVACPGKNRSKLTPLSAWKNNTDQTRSCPRAWRLSLCNYVCALKPPYIALSY